MVAECGVAWGSLSCFYQCARLCEGANLTFPPICRCLVTPRINSLGLRLHQHTGFAKASQSFQWWIGGGGLVSEN